MSTPSLAIRDFARRLVANEVAWNESRDALANGAKRVCEKLRLPLSKLAGVAGFRSLLSRALAMAKAECPILTAVQVGTEGSLEGLGGHDQESGESGEAGVVVVAQLLGLLVTFIGKPLTLRLVHDAWPSASMTEMNSDSGEGL